MCHMCGWIKLVLKNVRWAKIKIQKRWHLGRLSDGSIVQSLVHVYFCRSFLQCRLLGLQVTNRLAVFRVPIAYISPLAEHPNFLPNIFITNIHNPLGVFHIPKICTRNYKSKSSKGLFNFSSPFRVIWV